MERSTPAVTLDRGLPRADLRRVTVVLCATEIVSWGVLYYAFPVLAPSISRDTGWSPSAVVAAFTAAQLVSAGTGLLVGRHLHRHGPRAVMTLGSAAALAAVLVVARSASWPWFLAAWSLAGAAMAATLYPPAFAALTVWGGPRRLRALTALTLVGGLASTVFAPLTAVLDDRVGWRGAYTVLGLLLVGTVALHAWGLRAPWPDLPAPHPAAPGTTGAGAAPAWRTPDFGRTVASFTLAGLCLWSVVIAFVPLLVARGFSTAAAATALGIGGVGQVCGRLAYARLDALTGTGARTRVVFGAVAVTTLALALTPGPYPVLVALSFLSGTARGVFTLLHATAVTDRWGASGYARLNAAFSVPLLVAAALAPWLATSLAAVLGDHATALVALSGLAAASLVVVPGAPAQAPDGGRPGDRRPGWSRMAR